MSLVTPDFSEVQDPVTPGTYHARICKSELGEWEGKNGKAPTKFIKLQMETFNEEDSNNNGRKIFDNVAITGGGAFRIQQVYKACTGEDLTKESGGFDMEQLMGKEVQVIVSPNKKNPEYNDVTYKGLQ